MGGERARALAVWALVVVVVLVLVLLAWVSVPAGGEDDGEEGPVLCSPPGEVRDCDIVTAIPCAPGSNVTRPGSALARSSAARVAAPPCWPWSTGGVGGRGGAHGTVPGVGGVMWPRPTPVAAPVTTVFKNLIRLGGPSGTGSDSGAGSDSGSS